MLIGEQTRISLSGSDLVLILKHFLSNLSSKMAFRLLKVSPSIARQMSTNATTVGFIGLGQMGNRMATNLINKVLHGERDKRRQPRDVPTFWLKIIEKFSFLSRKIVSQKVSTRLSSFKILIGRYSSFSLQISFLDVA